MRYYRLFQKYQAGGYTPQDPLSISAKTKTTAGVTIETLTPQKSLSYFANGHYFVTLDTSIYTLNTDYILEWTFEMVLGHIQKIEEYFRLSATGGAYNFNFPISADITTNEVKVLVEV